MSADATAPAGRDPATSEILVGSPAMHTAEEAARLLKVKRSWLERQAAARKVPFSMLGGSYRFSDRHLAEIIRLNEIAPSPDASEGQPRRSPRRLRSTSLAQRAVGDIDPLRPKPRKARAT